jgi:hypothetical protein
LFVFVSVLGACLAAGTVPTAQQVQLIRQNCASELGNQYIAIDANGNGIDVTPPNSCGMNGCPTGFAPYICVTAQPQATAGPPPASANPTCLSCECWHVLFETAHI